MQEVRVVLLPQRIRVYLDVIRNCHERCFRGQALRRLRIARYCGQRLLSAPGRSSSAWARFYCAASSIFNALRSSLSYLTDVLTLASTIDHSPVS
jgi:hypothetical protein